MTKVCFHPSRAAYNKAKKERAEETAKKMKQCEKEERAEPTGEVDEKKEEE